MTVRDILRKAECSIQPNAGNVWLLAVNIWIKGVLKEVSVMLCWNKQEGEAESLLWHFVLGCRTVNLAPTKSWISSLLKRGLISLSRATAEVSFYLLNFSIPRFLQWVESSILLITYSPFMIQVLHFIWLLSWGAYWACGQTFSSKIFVLYSLIEGD